MNKLFDLRFVIGSFFTVVGLLLLVFSFVAGNTKDAETINRWCGIAFVAFGVVMIILSLQKDAHDELLEEEKNNAGRPSARH